MCSSEELTLTRDKKKLAPVLEKWATEAEAETSKLGALIETNNSAKMERPKIGLEVPWNIMEFLK
jgi:hypothetical protein